MAKVELSLMKEKVKEVFVRLGTPTADAEIMAEVLTDTQEKGILTHGYVRVPKYAHSVKCGGIKPCGEASIVVDTPSWALVDGGGGLGIVVARKATDIAIAKARATGIGIVNVRNSHHLGAAGYYAGLCADEGMIGVSMSNGDALVAVTGSCEKSIGNNPFSYAVPAGKYGKIIYDIAISAGSDMKIYAMKDHGERVPDGWMIDKDGKPSNDPDDYIERGGVLLPFGGYKGYGLGMMVEMFAAVLSGAANTTDVHAWNTTPGESGNVGHFIMAMDVSRIDNRDEFVGRVERVLDKMLSAKLADGTDKIYYPGEKEKIQKEICEKEGLVEVDDAILAKIEELLA